MTRRSLATKAPMALFEGQPIPGPALRPLARAGLSPDRLYRYSLERDWTPTGEAPRRVLFVMVNPSTADEATDDRTIGRCLEFARREGGTALEVVNLFAWRSTDVDALRGVPDRVGPENDAAIERAAERAHLVIVAWGAREKFRFAPTRPLQVIALLVGGPRLHCLGCTAAGDPRHPLYLDGATPLEPFPPAPRVEAPPPPAPAREPREARWADVAAECPDHRSAAAHCWPDAAGGPFVHVLRPGERVPRCVRGERRRDVGGDCYAPVGGLRPGERTTDSHRLAELVGRH